MVSQKVIRYYLLIISFLSLLSIVSSVYLFSSGFHNVDLGQNLKQINIITGQQFVDINSAGDVWTAEEMYIYGFKQQRQSLIQLGVSSILFGFAISKLMELR